MEISGYGVKYAIFELQSIKTLKLVRLKVKISCTYKKVPKSNRNRPPQNKPVLVRTFGARNIELWPLALIMLNGVIKRSCAATWYIFVLKHFLPLVVFLFSALQRLEYIAPCFFTRRGDELVTWREMREMGVNDDINRGKWEVSWSYLVKKFFHIWSRLDVSKNNCSRFATATPFIERSSLKKFVDITSNNNRQGDIFVICSKNIFQYEFVHFFCDAFSCSLVRRSSRARSVFKRHSTIFRSWDPLQNLFLALSGALVCCLKWAIDNGFIRFFPRKTTLHGHTLCSSAPCSKKTTSRRKLFKTKTYRVAVQRHSGSPFSSLGPGGPGLEFRLLLQSGSGS